MVNLSLFIAQVVHEISKDHSIFTFNSMKSKEEFFSDYLILQNVSKYSSNDTDSNHTRHSMSSECIYKGVSKIFRTGVAIYTAVAVTLILQAFSGEVYDFYSVDLEYFGYTLVILNLTYTYYVFFLHNICILKKIPKQLITYKPIYISSMILIQVAGHVHLFGCKR
jgi:hypothetical protein